MFTRYSKRILLLGLAITAIIVIPCRGTQVTVSQNFNLPIPSPDDPDSSIGRGRTDDAIINITEHYLIQDLDIAVLLTHDAFYDLEIVLQNPTGTKITLNPASNDAFIIHQGGSYLAGGQNRFLFDDEATVDIAHATEPFDQAFRPVSGSELSAFDGQDAFGQWRIQIRDVWIDSTGYLEQVELIITTPEPASFALLALGIAAICLRKPLKS